MSPTLRRAARVSQKFYALFLVRVSSDVGEIFCGEMAEWSKAHAC